MKKRLLTALIGVPLTIAFLFLYDTLAFNLIVGVISAVGVYEMLYNTKYVTHRELVGIGMVQAVFIAFSKTTVLTNWFIVIIMAFLILMLAAMFIKHHEISFQEVAMSFFVALAIPYALSSIVFVRDVIPEIGLYLIILMFSSAWICDSGAYFAGRAFGRHKLAPTISPKKTVEGAIGGVIVSIVVNILFTYVYMWIAGMSGLATKVNLLPLVLLILVASVVGILGDLTASIIKRQCGLKDFGNVFPGHGGVLDRFDSILFTAPFLYTTVLMFPMVSIL